MVEDTYTCADCGGAFPKPPPEEEAKAIAEAQRIWGPNAPLFDICDACDRKSRISYAVALRSQGEYLAEICVDKNRDHALSITWVLPVPDHLRAKMNGAYLPLADWWEGEETETVVQVAPDFRVRFCRVEVTDD